MMVNKKVRASDIKANFFGFTKNTNPKPRSISNEDRKGAMKYKCFDPYVLRISPKLFISMALVIPDDKNIRPMKTVIPLRRIRFFMD